MAGTITASDMRKVLKTLDIVIKEKGPGEPIFPNDVAHVLGMKVNHVRSTILKLVRVGCVEKIALKNKRSTYKVVDELYGEDS